MSETGCGRCPLTLGYCWSNAGCPVTLRSPSGPRSKWENDAPNCIHLKGRMAPWCSLNSVEPNTQLLLEL